MSKRALAVVPYRAIAAHAGVSVPLGELSRLTGLPPATLRRVASFAVIESFSDSAGNLRFPISQLPRLARGIRLRRDLGVNVQSLGLVLDLLERIDALDAQLSQVKTQQVERRVRRQSRRLP
jgi:DNA-binding transcriptional MerR regulator